MHRAFVSRQFIDMWIEKKTVALPSDVTHRFMRVVRVRPQERVAIFDGCGRQIIGVMEQGPNNNLYSIPSGVLSVQERPMPQIVLVQAAIELAKMSQTVQRSCEFGVDKIIVYEAERSDAFCFGKLDKKAEKLKSIAIDACRQSGRIFVPEIILIKDLTDALSQLPEGNSFGAFGIIEAKEQLWEKLSDIDGSQDVLFVVVGPEGGLSAKEASMLSQRGLHPLRWAPHVLRTESASLFAIAVFQVFCGRA